MPGEIEFRYVYAPKHITNILEKIQGTGRPDALTLEYIKKTWLLKDNNHSAVIPILRDMEFIDAAGHPLEGYKKYQNPTISKKILAEGIKKTYPTLFHAYPEAWREPKNIIQGYFKEQTGAKSAVLDKIISTFYALCGVADFTETKEGLKEEGKPLENKGTPKVTNGSTYKIEPNIQVNIGINIASDTPDDKIKTFFEYMRKYLLKPDNE